MKTKDENKRLLTGPHYSPTTKMCDLETVKAESLLQRIARNIAWYALRVARPEYCNAYDAVTFRFVHIKDRQRLATHLHCDELSQSKKELFGDNPPVPLHHVIFRG